MSQAVHMLSTNEISPLINFQCLAPKLIHFILLLNDIVIFYTVNYFTLSLNITSISILH